VKRDSEKKLRARKGARRREDYKSWGAQKGGWEIRTKSQVPSPVSAEGDRHRGEEKLEVCQSTGEASSKIFGGFETWRCRLRGGRGRRESGW